MSDDAREEPTVATERPVVLSKATLVPLGLIGGPLLALFAGYVWLDGRFTRLENAMDKFADGAADQWTVTDMRLWEESIRRRNPTMDVPSVRDITMSRMGRNR